MYLVADAWLSTFAASSNAEIGLEKIREQHPDTNDTNHQFITRWIDGNLLSERIIRLKNEYPTTEREYRQTNPEDEFNVRGDRPIDRELEI